jgi:ABC-type transporter Mla subunit MlaD
MDEYSAQSELNQQDRRIENQAIDQERRKHNDMQARVAVLEIKVSTAENRIEDTHQTQIRMLDKLDAHVIASTERDHQLQNTISQITGAVTILSGTVSETNETLKEIAKMATTSATQLMKWDTIAMTLIKVVTVIAIVIGGLWSVFTYLETKAHEKVALVDIPAHIAEEVAK